MDAVLTKITTSISEFKKNPNDSVAQAGTQPFAVFVLSVGKRADKAAYRAAILRILDSE